MKSADIDRFINAHEKIDELFEEYDFGEDVDKDELRDNVETNLKLLYDAVAYNSNVKDVLDDEEILLQASDKVQTMDDLIEQADRKERKDLVEHILINKVAIKNKVGVCILGLSYGLFDGEARSLREVTEVLNLKKCSIYDRENTVYNQLLREVRKSRLVPHYRHFIPRDRDYEVRFKNYGEFLQDYISGEKDEKVKENLTKVLAVYNERVRDEGLGK